MKIYKTAVLTALLGLLLVTGGRSAFGTSLNDIKNRVRMSSILLDTTRTPDSILTFFANEEREKIAILGNAIPDSIIIPLDQGLYSFALPAGCFKIYAVNLNGNPEDESNKTFALIYQPFNQFQMAYTLPTGRPSQYSFFGASLYVNLPAETENDTLTVYYFAHATRLSNDSEDIEIQPQFEPYLVESIIIRCFDRLTFTGPAREQVESSIVIMQKILFADLTEGK